MTDWSRRTTERLRLEAVDRTHQATIDLYADPRAGLLFPTGRAISRELSEAMAVGSERTWQEYELGYWSAWRLDNGEYVGTGGCVERGPLWNLFWKVAFTPEAGAYAFDLVAESISVARQIAPDRPIVATILGRDRAALTVAEQAGLTEVWVGPDKGNIDPTVTRRLWADRPVPEADLQPLADWPPG